MRPGILERARDVGKLPLKFLRYLLFLRTQFHYVVASLGDPLLNSRCKGRNKLSQPLFAVSIQAEILCDLLKVFLTRRRFSFTIVLSASAFCELVTVYSRRCAELPRLH